MWILITHLYFQSLLRPVKCQQILQFFEYESLIFHCEGSHDSTGLKIVHRSKGELLRCKTTVTSKRSSCTIHNIFPEDSGQYWCESRDGKRSDIIHITVTAGPVILESPISVVEGEAVTLRCRHKTTSTNLSADFYKDGRLIRRSAAGNLSIPSHYKEHQQEIQRQNSQNHHVLEKDLIKQNGESYVKYSEDNERDMIMKSILNMVDQLMEKKQRLTSRMDDIIKQQGEIEEQKDKIKTKLK
uniref:Ig-like domain-containing protein n=1 Tax=Labrus bergylta TaxID=56723 RepID=A0A3Q3MKA1_9LABR